MDRIEEQEHRPDQRELLIAHARMSRSYLGAEAYLTSRGDRESHSPPTAALMSFDSILSNLKPSVS
jgi:hypothetical protein